MKKLITYLKTLWSWGLDSQSNDISLDCRLTVGSPSGLDAKWKQNPFMRFAVVLTLIITIGSGNAWGAEGDVLKTYNTNSGTFTTGYKRQSGDNFVWWGQKNYYGANNATNHGNNKPTAADLPVVKAQNASATTSTTGLYYCYTSEAVANVGALEITFSAKSGSSTVNAYIVTSSTAASSGSATWTKVTLSASSANAQGKNVASANTYRFTFNATETGAKYYGVVFATSSYWRATGFQMKLIEGATATTPTLTVSKNSITSGLTYVSGGGPSAAQTFTVSGSDLSANVTVTAPTNFEVSKDGSSYAGSQTITASGTLSATTIYVRLKSGLAVNSYSGNITVASTGATSKTVSLSGSVTAPSYTVGWSITSGGGTLSTTSGMSTTVTPASGYRYASPAYTVLTGSATVVQSTNTFTATPTANSTIRINMEEIPSHTLSFNTGGLVSIPSVSVLEGATYNISQTPAASLSEDCEYATFVGWTTESSIANPSVKPSIVTSVTMSTSDVTLYAVYSKTTGGGAAPSAYSAGDTGDFVIASYNDTNDKWYAIPTNPTVSSGKITGDEITVNTSAGSVDYVTSTNASGYTWTIANASYGQTISDGSKYLYHSNGGASGTDLAYGNGTSYSWVIESETGGLTVQGAIIASSTKNNRGMLLQKTNTFGGYSLSNETNSAYSRIRILPIASAGTTTYSMSANCNMPTITVSTDDINFGDKKASSDRSISYTATFTVSGENLTDDIELSISGGTPTLFSVDKYTLEEDGGTVATTTITVTWTPSAASNQTDIHINSDGATEKIVHVHGTGKWEVTWMSHGGEHTTTLVASGTLPDFPAEDPTSCDLESSSFYGWTTEEWTGKLDNLAGKTVYTTNSGMATVSDNNRVYYAVFAKGTGSGSECYKKVTSTGSISNDGRYLIVYETDEVAFKGSLTTMDVTENTIDVTFDGSDITADATTKANEFTIDMTNLYVKSASDRWIDKETWDNGLGNYTSAHAVHSISIDGSGNLVIQGTGESSGSYVQLKYNANVDQARFRFYKSGQQDIQLYKYDPGVTYSKFLTTCCNTPTFTISGTGKTVEDGKIVFPLLREDLEGAATTTWATQNITFSSNSEGAISVITNSSKTAAKLSWQSRATTGGTWANVSTHAKFEITSAGNARFSVKTADGYTGQGTYRIGLHQEANGDNCETDIYIFVDVTLRDKFVDAVNGNGTINKDGHGAQVATPLLSEFGTQVENACHSEGRKLKGWIKETDLKSKYETGNSERVQTIDGLCETCDDATDWTSLVVAPGANITTSGVTWYAVWAYER